MNQNSLSAQETLEIKPRHGRRAFLAGGVGLLAAVGGTAGWAANRYLIPHEQVANANEITEPVVNPGNSTTSPSANSEASSPASSEPTNTAGTVDGMTYTSSTAQITINKVATGSGSSLITYYAADVTVSDATILRSAFAQNSFGLNIIDTPSAILSQVGGILAVNGDYYGFRDTGIVIRNGRTFRDAGARQGLALTRDGELRIYDETATNAQSLVNDGVWQTWSFGPGLVNNGAVMSGIDSVEVDTNVGNRTIQGPQPRTGIGMIEPNHFLLIAADGRSDESRGVTMTEFANIFKDLGAQVAYNLDGGGSTAMIFNDSLINNPRGREQERGTSDIVYIAG